ncbi:MAG: hypothetical protein ABSF22_16360 [Bryobacteraceae bacterium]
MKFAKSILTGTGAVVLAGLILALLAPKAAHAIAATAVQVENTVASPVVSQSILPGTPFSATCTSLQGTQECQLLPATPAGYTFHVTYFSEINYYEAPTTVPDLVQVGYTSGGTHLAHIDIAAPLAVYTIASHPVDWYIDPGTNMAGGLSTNGNSGLFTAQLTVSGYLTH